MIVYCLNNAYSKSVLLVYCPRPCVPTTGDNAAKGRRLDVPWQMSHAAYTNMLGPLLIFPREVSAMLSTNISPPPYYTPL